MPIPTVLNGFDVASAVERMLGQSGLWWQAVGLFLQHFSDWEQAWLSARGNDADECKKVHALRSAAANVGANDLCCAACVLEELLRMRLAGKSVEIPPSVRWYLQDCFRFAWHSASEVWLTEGMSVGGMV